MKTPTKAKTALSTLLTVACLSGSGDAETRISFGPYLTATEGAIGETVIEPGSTVVSTITLTTGLTFDSRSQINLKGVSQDISTWTLTINGVDYAADPGTFYDELYLITTNQINFLGTKAGDSSAFRFNTNPAAFPPTAAGYPFAAGNEGETIEDWYARISPVTYVPKQDMIFRETVTFNGGLAFSSFENVLNGEPVSMILTEIAEDFVGWSNSFSIEIDEEGDVDGDGITNLVEYALGFDPTQSDAFPEIVDGQVVFTKGEAAAKDSALSYIIQTSPTMEEGSWVDSDSQTETEEEVGLNLTAGGEKRLFARLKVLHES